MDQEQKFNEIRFDPIWHKFATSKYDDPELATIKSEDGQKFMKALLLQDKKKTTAPISKPFSEDQKEKISFNQDDFQRVSKDEKSIQRAAEQLHTHQALSQSQSMNIFKPEQSDEGKLNVDIDNLLKDTITKI